MTRPRKRNRTLAGALTSLPDVVLLPALWLCLITTVTIVLGVFNPWTVVPATLVLTVLTWRWRPDPYRARFAWQSTLAAIVFIVGWFAVNARFHAQYLIVDRDPGFLTLEGFWLRHHGSGNIPVGSAGAVVAAVPGASAQAMGYSDIGGTLYAQGAKVLSGLLAIGGWVGETTLLLAANLVIGAAALFAFYGFARRIVGPLWSLLGLVGLGVSMPFIAFTRSAFTEPLVLALTFGGLTFIWVALKGHRWQHFVVGGALLGAGGLARIDGASIIVGFAAGMALVAWGGVNARLRRNLRRGFLLSVGSALVTLLIGLADLLLDSPAYVSDLRDQIVLLFSAMFVTLILGLAITTERPWGALRRWFARHRRLIANIAAGLVVLVALVLLSRPLWLVSHGAAVPLVGGMQGAEGVPIDPTRTYDEMSVTWISWYFGWATVLAGFAGMALAVRHALRARNPQIMVFVSVIAASSLLYLVKVSIVADQIWAMRRLLPITIPGLILLALWLIRRAWLWSRRRAAGVRLTTRILAVGLAVVTAGFPLFTWGNMFRAVEHNGRLNEANVLCSRLPADHVVYTGPQSYLPTLRIYCGVEVVQFAKTPTATQLADVVKAWGGGPVAFVSSTADGVPWSSGAAPAPTTANLITRWPNTLTRIPHDANVGTSQFWVGSIGADGSVTAVAPNP